MKERRNKEGRKKCKRGGGREGMKEEERIEARIGERRVE